MKKGGGRDERERERARQPASAEEVTHLLLVTVTREGDSKQRHKKGNTLLQLVNLGNRQVMIPEQLNDLIDAEPTQELTL